MRIEIFGIDIVDFDFSFGECAGIVIIAIVVFLIMISRPLWR
jgi:hypothetical protein